MKSSVSSIKSVRSVTDSLPDKLLLCNRYIVNKSSELGEGSTATVLKGFDRLTKTNVAVKFYQSTGGVAMEDFQRAIKVSQLLHESVAHTMRSSSESSLRSGKRASCNIAHMEDALKTSGVKKDAFELMMSLDIGSCFVKVLDYSQDDGEPGIDEDTGMLFLIQEMGGMSLEEKLEQRKAVLDDGDESAGFQAEEVKDLFWSLVCITFGLHYCGYVHMDIKPLNIMEFDGEGGKHWKLIDLDGAILANQSVSLDEPGRLSFTQLYMPPELALAFCEKAAGPRLLRSPSRSRFLKSRAASAPQVFSVTTSRSMDVWSVAMCILQAIFFVPVLEPVLEKMRAEHGEAGADLRYYQYLSSSDSDAIISGRVKNEIMLRFGRDLCELLDGMLKKDPKERFCMAKCLTHHFFHAHWKHLMGDDSKSQLDESQVESILALANASEREEKKKSAACALM
eukprot:TRINITY_DN9611_c0_g1_i1.p1 TRINITY_DN9611_c0_g1~~TRINITY_DN9611_c0_g1_i1.p1  ORF type:complete len:452 (-),score=126.90 TRINITY_DN9611_c0_g1_i1:162-1517(-)